MAKIDLTSKDWCELVFEDKNKEYGAYQMRRTSPRRHTTAMIIVALIVVLLISLKAVITFVTPKQDKVVITEVTTISKLPPPEVKNNDEIKKVDAPPPPPLKSSIKFTAPVIKKDEEVREEDEIKSQEEIIESKVAISIADVKGNDEEHGKDIAELKEIAQDVEEVMQTYAVEEKPQFPGGEEAMYKYIREHLVYPYVALETGTQGRVFIQFVVSKTGEITDVTIARGISDACDKEALRVVKSMPRWIPGKQNGRAVSVYFVVPILFQIAER